MQPGIRKGAPLFLRIFLVMLAAVALVQVLSTALIFLQPPPVPPIVSADSIIDMLRTGKSGSGDLRLSDTPPPSNIDETSFPEAMHRRIARQLGVAPERVKLYYPARFRPKLPPLPKYQPPPSSGNSQSGAIIRERTAENRDDLLFGDFSVSVQLEDGSWRTVKPTLSGLEYWRSRAVAWLLISMIAVAPFAWWLARRIAKPIALFARAAETLGKDPRSTPLSLAGPSEIAEAAAAFNQMQARLSRYVEDRSMFMAAVAHDLRTPLMRLSLRLESAPESIQAAVREDVEDMDAMIRSLLSLLRDLSASPRRQRLDLRAIAQSVTDRALDEGGQVALVDGDPLIIEADPISVKALVANLVQNALLYAGDATIMMGRSQDHAWLEVHDNGPGIPDNLLGQVFEPFFRVEASRNRETGGVGLGLASVRAIARAHGGDVVLSNRAQGGLTARVTLPM